MKMLIIMNLHSNPCFIYLSVWLHLLVQAKWGSRVPHYPFSHVLNSSVNIFESFGCMCALLLNDIKRDNQFVHSEKFAIQCSHGGLQSWYLSHYWFPLFCHGGSSKLLCSLPNLLWHSSFDHSIQSRTWLLNTWLLHKPKKHQPWRLDVF